MIKSKKMLLGGCLTFILILIVGGYSGINYLQSKISLTDYEQMDTTYKIDEYKILIYENGEALEFIAFNYLITDKSKWVYKMTKEDDIEYFDRIWNEK